MTFTDRIIREAILIRLLLIVISVLLITSSSFANDTSETAPIRIIKHEKSLAMPVSVDHPADTVVNLLEKEPAASRTIVLTQPGDILFAPDDRTAVGKDGKMYSLDFYNNSMYTVDPATNKTVHLCTGTDIIASAEGVRLFEQSLPFCIEKPVFSVREGKVYGMFIKEGGSRLSGTKFIAPDGTVTHVENVPLGLEIAATDSGYYMVALNEQLEVYAFDRNFHLIKIYRIAGHAAAPHLTVDANGTPHLAYYNARKKTLVYARLESEKFRTYELGAPDSGFQNSIDNDGKDVIIASYYVRNSYNKGILLHRIPVKAVDVRAELKHCVFLRRKDENIGWFPSISTNGAEVALAALNTTRNQTEIFRFDKSYIDNANDFKQGWLEPWMEKQKKTNLYAEFGYEYLHWNSVVNTHFMDLTGAVPPPGRFRMKPLFLEEVGLGGGYDDISFGFEYLENVFVNREEKNAPGAEKRTADYLAGNLNFENAFGYDNALEIHVRSGMLTGSYLNSGISFDFSARYFDMDVDLFDKEAFYFFGLEYRRYLEPQPIIVSQAGVITESYVTRADFSNLSLILGYSNLNYIRRYENEYKGLYVDTKAGVGLASVSLEREPSVPADIPDCRVYRLSVDTGYMLFKRFESLRYLSYFIKAGVDIDATYVYARPKNETDSADPQPVINIERLDFLYGGYVTAGVAF